MNTDLLKEYVFTMEVNEEDSEEYKKIFDITKVEEFDGMQLMIDNTPIEYTRDSDWEIPSFMRKEK